MSNIIVNFDPFCASSRVEILNDDVRTSEMIASKTSTITEYIINQAYSNHIYRVLIHAPRHFVDEFAELIHQKEMNQYSANKITVEGI